jgi:PAS domain-containing protein
MTTETNQALCEMFGYSRDELIGLYVRNLTYPGDGHLIVAGLEHLKQGGAALYRRTKVICKGGSALLHPDSLDVMREALETVKVGGSYRRAAAAVRKDGRPFYVEGPSCPFTFRNEPHIMAVVRDITEQVEAEQRLSPQANSFGRNKNSIAAFSRPQPMASSLTISRLGWSSK